MSGCASRKIAIEPYFAPGVREGFAVRGIERVDQLLPGAMASSQHMVALLTAREQAATYEWKSRSPACLSERFTSLNIHI